MPEKRRWARIPAEHVDHKIKIGISYAYTRNHRDKTLSVTQKEKRKKKRLNESGAALETIVKRDTSVGTADVQQSRRLGEVAMPDRMVV